MYILSFSYYLLLLLSLEKTIQEQFDGVIVSYFQYFCHIH